MADRPKPDADPRAGEERLAHALISRGRLTHDEFQTCRPGPGEPAGAEALLARLAAAGLLTAGQARRAKDELSLLLNQPIPGYELREKLGKGAMGVVFK